MGKQFHLGDILSVTTGKLLSPKGMGGLSDLLCYMTGGILFDCQFPRAARVCSPILISRMPWLETFNTDDVNPDNWESWLREQVERFGEYHDIDPLSEGFYKQVEPEEELKDMGLDESQIITIVHSE